MNYFIEYILGWKSEPNIKTRIGTCVHKVLEELAKAKLALQNNQSVVSDEVFGDLPTADFFTTNNDELIPFLTKKSFDTYILNIKGSYDKIKPSFVKELIRWYDKTGKSTIPTLLYKDCLQLVNNVLELNDGAFNPLLLNIVAPESSFNITIDEPWAKYKYIYNAKEISGQLSIKGTMDLITSPSEGILELCDYKSGLRRNWAKGIDKTDDMLRNDVQLLMYYYAISKLYPHIDQIIVTIFYIRNNDPTTMVFDRSDLPKILDILRTKFEYIKKTQIPRLSRDYKCKSFCHHGLTTFANTSIKPQIEFRKGDLSPCGACMKRCSQVHWYIGKYGIEKTIADYNCNGFDVDFYQNPGEV